MQNITTENPSVCSAGPREKAVPYFAGLGLEKPPLLPEAEFLQQLTSAPEDFLADKVWGLECSLPWYCALPESCTPYHCGSMAYHR